MNIELTQEELLGLLILVYDRIECLRDSYTPQPKKIKGLIWIGDILYKYKTDEFRLMLQTMTIFVKLFPLLEDCLPKEGLEEMFCFYKEYLEVNPYGGSTATYYDL